MSLGIVVDELADRLAARLGGGVSVSDQRPAEVGDLPRVTISVLDAERPHIGIGGTPRAPEVGALEVQATVDLADPVIDVGGESIRLVDPSRRTLILPNGPLVTAAGTTEGPYTAADLSVVDPGGAYAVVSAEPAGRQVRPDPDAGTLRFGQPRPAAGDLVVDYRIGRWEVESLRYLGHVEVEVTAVTGTALATLARLVATALDDLGGSFERLVPTAWGAAEPGLLGEDDVVRHRHQHLFAYERQQPVVPTGGGIIRLVDVTSRSDSATERFAIPVGGAVP
jgi:hypothetical protein